MTTPRIKRSDDGFTLTELLVVVLILGIVSAVLLTTLDTLTRTAAETEAKAQSLADTRTALETIARDLRAANPVNPLTSGATSQYDTAVEFGVYCSSGTGCTGNERTVQYTVVNNELRRTVEGVTTTLLGPTGSPTLARTLRRGAILNSAVFSYFERDGDQIVTSTDPTTGSPSEYFRDCTKRVRIELVVRSQANKAAQTIELGTTVTLRNHNEVNPCT